MRGYVQVESGLNLICFKVELRFADERQVHVFQGVHGCIAPRSSCRVRIGSWTLERGSLKTHCLIRMVTALVFYQTGLRRVVYSACIVALESISTEAKAAGCVR